MKRPSPEGMRGLNGVPSPNSARSRQTWRRVSPAHDSFLVRATRSTSGRDLAARPVDAGASATAGGGGAGSSAEETEAPSRAGLLHPTKPIAIAKTQSGVTVRTAPL